MPRSMMSAASSGGVLSSVDLIASMICETGSSSARRTSSELRTTVFGRPVSMSRPLTSACTSSLRSHAEPTSSLISSAVCCPTSSLYSGLMWLMIASSIWSPPTRSDCETTMPPSEMTATSVVPPPMSTIMFPVGSATGSPAPIAAAPGPARPATGLLGGGGLAGARRQRCLFDGALLDARHPRRHAHDDARMREAMLMHLLDEVPKHLLGHVEVCDDAVLQRTDRLDRARRAAEHALCLDADGVHLTGALVDRDDRRL